MNMEQPYRLTLKFAAGPVLVLSYHDCREDADKALAAHVEFLRASFEEGKWQVRAQDTPRGTTVVVYKDGQYKPLIKKTVFLLVEEPPAPRENPDEKTVLLYQSWYKKVYGRLHDDLEG